MSNAATSAIVRLRRLALRLGKPGDEDGQWFAAALAEYEAGAPFGLTLGDAFGFRLGPGERPWFESERLELRDQVLREIAQRYVPQRSARSAAKEILRVIGRYEAGQWKHDKAFVSLPDVDPLRAILHRLLKLGPSLGFTTIRTALLANGPPPFRWPPDQRASIATEEVKECEASR